MTPCIDCQCPGRTVLCAPCKDRRRQARPAPIGWRNAR